MHSANGWGDFGLNATEYPCYAWLLAVDGAAATEFFFLVCCASSLISYWNGDGVAVGKRCDASDGGEANEIPVCAFSPFLPICRFCPSRCRDYDAFHAAGGITSRLDG